MKFRTLAPVALLAVGAVAPSVVAAQDDTKQGLTDETARFQAQAARDNAEAAAIKAAADLAKAKALAADQDTAALQAKAAKDQAEAAALAAAKALADAKTAAANQDVVTAKAQLDAQAALATSKVTADVAEITALKAAFGNVPTIGSDGNVTISDSTTGMLLESKSGSLKTTAALASELCKVLQANSVKGAFIVPPEMDRKIVSARFVLREFDQLSQEATASANLNLLGGAVTAQIAPAAILSAISLLQYGAGAVQSLSRMFRSDYTISLADAKRDTWLQYFMAAQCPTQLATVDLEALERSKPFDDDLAQLNALASFVERFNAQRKIETARLERIRASIKALRDANKPVPQGELESEKSVQAMLDSLARLEGVATRIKVLVDFVATQPQAFIDALVWRRVAQSVYGQERPRLTVALTTQDGQVSKTHWLTGKRVYGRSSGELIYRVAKADGSVVLAGYLVATNSDGEINFSANAQAEAKGPQFPSQRQP